MNTSKGEVASPEKIPGCTFFKSFLSPFSTADEKNMIKDSCGLFKENLFRILLVMERKRSERNNKPFMLIRIDYRHCSDFFRETGIIKELVQDLSTVTRENDVKGWFKRGRVIGVLVADINVSVSERIFRKIEAKIRERFPGMIYDKLSIKKDIFPDTIETDNLKSIYLNSVIYANGMNVSAGTVMRIIKRSIDIAGSIVGTILFSPFFLIIPLVIKLTSEGPVFFTQRRVGRFGKTFVCIKFRTMKKCNDDTVHREFVKKFISSSGETAPLDKNAVFKIEDDPRVTGIGKFLRKTSLDEIPQFFNVLLGQMSIVGPRPAIPYEVNEYNIWHRRRVFETKPGITGFWQVKGRSRTDFNNMVRMDIQYINSWSLINDLKLIVATPVAMVAGRGAY